MELTYELLILFYTMLWKQTSICNKTIRFLYWRTPYKQISRVYSSPEPVHIFFIDTPSNLTRVSTGFLAWHESHPQRLMMILIATSTPIKTELLVISAASMVDAVAHDVPDCSWYPWTISEQWTCKNEMFLVFSAYHELFQDCCELTPGPVDAVNDGKPSKRRYNRD